MPKNSNFKPLSTVFVPCMKIQGVYGPLPPAADAHVFMPLSINKQIKCNVCKSLECLC